jgi:crossover junction endodeoxyribonuclease RuvC
VEGSAAGTLSAVAVDVIRTPSASPLGDRLVFISAALERWIEQFHPDAVAVERVSPSTTCAR